MTSPITAQVDDLLNQVTSDDFLPTPPAGAPARSAPTIATPTSAATMAAIDRLPDDVREEAHALAHGGNAVAALRHLQDNGVSLIEARRIANQLATLPNTTRVTRKPPVGKPGPRKPATLNPIGERTRPNSQVYKPRHIGVHEDLALLRAAQNSRSHVLLYGPPGTGKTAMVEAAFASNDGVGLETLIGSADTTEMDLLGTFVPAAPGSGQPWDWAPGPLHRSVMNDVPLLIDEIALIDPRVLPIVYGLMDGRGVLHIPANPQLPPVPLRKNWFLIAACNPHVPGANLSEALLSRFDHHILVESDWDLARELGVSGDIVTISKNLDLKRRKGQLTWSPQLRDLLSFRNLADQLGGEYAAANLVSKAQNEDDRNEIMQALKTKFPKIVPLAVGPRYGI
ncbi:hypothetical protein GCM10009733_020880 [Nonomuraea maheshkhaliensis]|uniref:ATPase dynein-related AAA domain-containing protein n=1 Tax=Nonomuraea maheshkhaliensis TaxID=419590 RepID=A0ABN2F009_9ACTN